MSIPVVLGFESNRPSEKFLSLIEKYSPFGVILFERNFTDVDSIYENIRSLKSASSNSLIMIDEEGGAKSRIRREHGFPNPPNPREVASCLSLDEAEDAYRILGTALADLGIDVDLAPVVDVAPENHILGGRAFSDDSLECVEYASAIVRGLQSGGVKTCAKHFPGLGSAIIDPHLKTAVSEASKQEFEEIHFPPFKRAIESGTDFVMSTHLRANSLDPSGKIATLSGKIIEVIRNMGFTGDILTDDLLMGGAIENASISTLALESLKAGHDAVLICREIDGIEAILDEIAQR